MGLTLGGGRSRIEARIPRRLLGQPKNTRDLLGMRAEQSAICWRLPVRGVFERLRGFCCCGRVAAAVVPQTRPY